MDLQLKDKIIIVSGGAKGIGEGISKVLAAEGAVSIIVGRNAADNTKVANEIAEAGGKSFQVEAELTKPEECESAIKIVAEKYGRCWR